MTEYLCNANEDVVILCAGWKDRFSLEDALYAGALADKLLASGDFNSECDSVTSSIDLWNIAKGDLLAYQKKFAHSHRLKTLMLDDVIEFCLTADQTDKVPRFEEGIITMAQY
jgi:2-phosphosulfolactate phosphatase